MNKQLFCITAMCICISIYGQEGDASTLRQDQGDEGIHWTTGLSWQQVLQKARQENKYIFLDCFATWCQPCHLMDKTVYPDEKVGEAINDRFISVKVQMDKTNYDNDTVKRWYVDAARIEKNYAVTAFPTFLFFYPDGRPMHRAVGYKKPEEFINLSRAALDSQKQYYAVLANYKPGKFDTSELKGLARALKSSGGDLASKLAAEYLSRIPKEELANDDNMNLMIEFRDDKSIQEFAGKYLSDVPIGDLMTKKNMEFIRNFSSVAGVKQLVLTNYLEALDQKDLSEHLPLLTIFKKEPEAQKIAKKFIDDLQPDRIFKKDILFFIADFTGNSGEKGFKIFFNHTDTINKVVEINDYAQSVIDNIIIDEEYNPYYKAAIEKNVDSVPWDKIARTVLNKYGREVSERLNIWVKSSLYGYFAQHKNKYWPEYIDYYIQKIEKFGTDTAGPMHQMIDAIALNNFVFTAIFYHSDNKKQIETGLKWMEGVIRRNPTAPNHIDTYANLLYKAGRVKEALEWQRKAILIATENKEEGTLKMLNGNLTKMQRGEPTWVKDPSK